MDRDRSRIVSTPKLRLCSFDEDQAAWQELMKSAKDKTLYHRHSWIRLLSTAYGFQSWLATLHKDGRIIAGCVCAHPRLSRRFVALPFSDACPPLALEPQAADCLLRALAVDAPRGRTYEVRGIGGVSSWKTVEYFVNWWLMLDRSLPQIQKHLAINFRRNVRRASRHTVRIERGSGLNLLERFYSLQLMSRRRLGLPPQPWSFFRLTKEIFRSRRQFRCVDRPGKRQGCSQRGVSPRCRRGPLQVGGAKNRFSVFRKPHALLGARSRSMLPVAIYWTWAARTFAFRG